MAFARIPEQFPHTKPFLEMGPRGRGFFVDALSWCNEHRSDGFIAEAELRHVSPGERFYRKLAETMWAFGVFERVKGRGWQIPPAIYRMFNLFAKDIKSRPLPPTSPARRRLDSSSLTARHHANHSLPGPEPPPAAPSYSGSDSMNDVKAETGARSLADLIATAEAYDKLGRPDLADARRQLAKALGRSDAEPPAAKEETA